MSILIPMPPRYPEIDPQLRPFWERSGIESMPGDHSWIYNLRGQDYMPRNQEILIYANRAYGDKLRKFGPAPRLTHQIIGMDMIHNFPDLEAWGIDRDFAEIMFAAHDIGEDLREKTLKDGHLFTALDAEKVFANIFRILDDVPLHENMREVQGYITDRHGIKGWKRLSEQIVKSFDPDGECIISPTAQLIRGVDKREQVGYDRWARENGYLPDAALQKQTLNAIEREYVLELPVIKANKQFVEGYKEDRAFLQRELIEVFRKKANIRTKNGTEPAVS